SRDWSSDVCSSDLETPDLRAEPRRVRPGADDLEVGAFQRGVARGEGGGEGVERVAVALPVEQTPDADEADGAVARRRELPEPRDGGVAEGHAIANLDGAGAERA